MYERSSPPATGAQPGVGAENLASKQLGTLIPFPGEAHDTKVEPEINFYETGNDEVVRFSKKYEAEDVNLSALEAGEAIIHYQNGDWDYIKNGQIFDMKATLAEKQPVARALDDNQTLSGVKDVEEFHEAPANAPFILAKFAGTQEKKEADDDRGRLASRLIDRFLSEVNESSKSSNQDTGEIPSEVITEMAGMLGISKEDAKTMAEKPGGRLLAINIQYSLETPRNGDKAARSDIKRRTRRPSSAKDPAIDNAKKVVSRADKDKIESATDKEISFLAELVGGNQEYAKMVLQGEGGQLWLQAIRLNTRTAQERRKAEGHKKRVTNDDQLTTPGIHGALTQQGDWAERWEPKKGRVAKLGQKLGKLIFGKKDYSQADGDTSKSKTVDTSATNHPSKSRTRAPEKTTSRRRGKLATVVGGIVVLLATGAALEVATDGSPEPKGNAGNSAKQTPPKEAQKPAAKPALPGMPALKLGSFEQMDPARLAREAASGAPKTFRTPSVARSYKVVNMKAGSGNTVSDEAFQQLLREGNSNPTQRQIMRRTAKSLRASGKTWPEARHIGENGDETVKIVVSKRR